VGEHVPKYPAILSQEGLEMHPWESERKKQESRILVLFPGLRKSGLGAAQETSGTTQHRCSMGGLVHFFLNNVIIRERHKEDQLRNQTLCAQ
jgi:hypothetical protein